MRRFVCVYEKKTLAKHRRRGERVMHFNYTLYVFFNNIFDVPSLFLDNHKKYLHFSLVLSDYSELTFF